MRRTKIICTLGPSTDDENILKELILNGMDVARLNMSHQDQKCQKKRADSVKKLREELGLPIALLLDTKGPEIRTGKIKSDSVKLKKNQEFTLTSKDILGDETKVSISFKGLIKDISPGIKILLDDGLIELLAIQCTKDSIICKVLNSGILSSNKSVNVPGIKLSLPFISEKDFDDLKFAVKENFDFIAASFTRSAEDIILLRKKLNDIGGSYIKIIAKIENCDGIKNIDEIIRVSDGIMVARGDLGVEVPLEEIPVIQKKLIRKACDAGKHVITATQMLDSMIKNPRPTRAESTDVANAIYDGTSAIMLSGETAAGMYPVNALKIMSIIASRAESDIDYKKRFFKISPNKPTITSAISHATCTTALDLGAVAILTVTKSGRTAGIVSKYRPICPIIAGTSDKTVMRQMNLLWGVIPLFMEEEVSSTNELFNHIVNVTYKNNYIKDGDLVVITAGVPLGETGSTNLLKVHLVGNILVSGCGITNLSVKGNLCVCQNEKEAFKKFKPGDILVVPETSNNILDIIKEASAIITESPGETSHAAMFGLAFDKPVITGAKEATKLLKDNQSVTVDAKRGIVFNTTSNNN